MDAERTARYYELLESLVSEISAIPVFDRTSIVETVKGICELFRLTKAVTEFYRSEAFKKRGEVERISDYDNGKSGRLAMQRRMVSKTGASVISSVYMEEGDELTPDEEAKVDILLRTVVSFIARNRLQNAIEQLGFHDEEGYPNMRSFMRYIDKLGLEGKMHEYTAVCFNLRRFGLINQQFGREVGDLVIKKYFNIIKGIIGEKGHVIRIGGDNFAAVFKSELGDQVIEVFKGVAVTYEPGTQKRVLVSACAGIYDITEEFAEQPPRSIMDMIFPTMHTAKSETNGNIVYYDEQMVAMRDHTMHVRELFPKAIKNGEFHVFYQPKVDVTWGRLVGAEALCRWFHDGKIVPPMEFIPVFEQNTDICKLDYLMLEMVCKDIRRWIDMGRRVVRVSVNFSRKNLTDIDLLSNIIEIVDRYEIPHEFIEIELTETTTDVAFRDLRRVVTGLEEAGIATAVDDFGIGYSSLTLLQDIPWRVLKIDRSFLPTDEEKIVSKNHMMFKHVVSMAREIGLECVTEGVETKKQVMILRKNHCHVAQGFFFDKPMPVNEYEARLDNPMYDLSHLSEEWRFRDDEEPPRDKV